MPIWPVGKPSPRSGEPTILQLAERALQGAAEAAVSLVEDGGFTSFTVLVEYVRSRGPLTTAAFDLLDDAWTGVIGIVAIQAVG